MGHEVVRILAGEEGGVKGVEKELGEEVFPTAFRLEGEGKEEEGTLRAGEGEAEKEKLGAVVVALKVPTQTRTAAMFLLSMRSTVSNRSFSEIPALEGVRKERKGEKKRKEKKRKERKKEKKKLTFLQALRKEETFSICLKTKLFRLIFLIPAPTELASSQRITPLYFKKTKEIKDKNKKKKKKKTKKKEKKTKKKQKKKTTNVFKSS